MRNFFTLLGRELLALFVGPTAYITAVLFTFLVSVVFVGKFAGTGLAEPETLFMPLGYVLPVFLAPLLTMRLLAEEKRSGSLELLMTAPVGDWEVTGAKFAGVFVFYCGMTLLTLIHVYVMFRWYGGPLDWGSFLCAYLGTFLLAGMFLAFGLFCSSLFDNQLPAAGTGLTAGLFLLLIGWIVDPNKYRFGAGRRFLEFLLPISHYRNFLNGLLDTRDVAYFMGLTGWFLFLTVKVVESRKWR